ncbi:low calcium response locus protein H [Carpediemonas membranifera]|uniref:Low calcium response locus protein H n=1 Tax=Carpediemonas membranifera TaxID=201153 RepID=A0A8J6ARB7_9EUKA|nr:low calcium response locus protein H [Carpediemonas membranifera]|eukprot:KAG9390215.1 low calcium response locus protein H [Carpediemonas membranifera]
MPISAPPKKRGQSRDTEEPVVIECESCGSTDVSVQCFRCFKVFYCCEEHAAQSWKRHSRECQTVSRERRTQFLKGCFSIRGNLRRYALDEGQELDPVTASNTAYISARHLMDHKMFTQALHLFGNFQRASIQAFGEPANPDIPAGWYHRAVCHMALHQPEKAMICATRALDRIPPGYEATLLPFHIHMVLCGIHRLDIARMTEHLDKAREVLSHCIPGQPPEALAVPLRAHQAFVLLGNARPADAAAIFKDCLQQSHHFGTEHAMLLPLAVNTAVSHEISGNFAAALVAYQSLPKELDAVKVIMSVALELARGVARPDAASRLESIPTNEKNATIVGQYLLALAADIGRDRLLAADRFRRFLRATPMQGASPQRPPPPSATPLSTMTAKQMASDKLGVRDITKVAEYLPFIADQKRTVAIFPAVRLTFESFDWYVPVLVRYATQRLSALAGHGHATPAASQPMTPRQTPRTVTRTPARALPTQGRMTPSLASTPRLAASPGPATPRSMSMTVGARPDSARTAQRRAMALASTTPRPMSAMGRPYSRTPSVPFSRTVAPLQIASGTPSSLTTRGVISTRSTVGKPF